MKNKYSLSYHPAVEAEVRDATLWYKKIRPELSEKLANEIKSALKKIEENPLQFQRKFKNIRSCYLKNFPYGIHFQVVEDDIQIYAFFHTSQNPEIWQSRK